MLKNFIVLTALLALTNANILGEPGKKSTKYKRAVDPYSYPVPSINFEEKPGKSKVTVETIKSISPPGHIPSNGYIPGTNVPGTTIPVGSVSYSAFEPDNTKKLNTAGLSPTVTTTSYNNKPAGNYGNVGYQSGSSSTGSLSSTASPAPATSLLPGYQYNSRVTTSSGTSALPDTGKTRKISGSKIKPNGYGYGSSKVTKKPTKTNQKHSDSKPEGTGFNGYHYGVVSNGFGTPTKFGGGGGGGVGGASGGFGGAGGSFGGSGAGGASGSFGGSSAGGAGGASGGFGGSGAGGASGGFGGSGGSFGGSGASGGFGGSGGSFGGSGAGGAGGGFGGSSGSFGGSGAGGAGGSGQGGMMGASYMRSSSPFYNFHVMLD